jgi:hypothetical protein
MEGVGPENNIKLKTIQYRIQNTAATKLMYIKLNYHCTCFFIWRLDFVIFMKANSLLGPLEGVGPRNGFSPIKIIKSYAL